MPTLSKITLLFSVLLMQPRLLQAESRWQLGLGLGYSLFLIGDLQDYFSNNFSSQAFGFYQFDANSKHRLMLHWQAPTYYSDDVRRSSQLALKQIAAGYWHRIKQSQSHQWSFYTLPELTFYEIKHNLSRAHPKQEQGHYWGIVSGLQLSFFLGPSWYLAPYLNVSIPQFNLRNLYGTSGGRLGYSF